MTRKNRWKHGWKIEEYQVFTRKIFWHLQDCKLNQETTVSGVYSCSCILDSAIPTWKKILLMAIIGQPMVFPMVGICMPHDYPAAKHILQWPILCKEKCSSAMKLHFATFCRPLVENSHFYDCNIYGMFYPSFY